MIAGRENCRLLKVSSQVLAINFLQKGINVFIQRELFGYKSIIVANAKEML